MDIDSTYVSASRTRNFLLNDHLIDWLELYGESKGYIKDDRKYSFSKYIMNMGKKFESYIYNIIKSKFKNNECYTVSTFNGKEYSENETIRQMSIGTPIIYQGFLVNRKNKTCGYPDIIIRSDYLNKLMENDTISSGKERIGCKFSPNYHYRIIDIKYSTLNLKSNSKTLLNVGSTVAYKGQVYLYNEALGRIQNFVPRKSYILGRGYKRTNEDVKKPFSILGEVDFVEETTIKENINECLEWFKLLRENGSGWDIYPKPSVCYLYPNMKADNDSWKTVKSNLAKNLKDITLVWNCGIKEREILHDKGIMNYLDDNCNSNNMDKGGKINNVIIDNILETNRGKENKKCKLNLEDGYYVDFETISNVYDITGSSTDKLVMIGIVTNDVEDVLVADKMDEDSERSIIIDFLEKITPEGYNNPIVYHYSNFEPQFFYKKLKELNIQTTVNIVWVDLLKIIKDNNIYIKGCLNFSLKSYMDAFSIENKDDDIFIGSEAMVALISYYQNGDNIIEKIKEYNIKDCKMLMVLRKYLSE